MKNNQIGHLFECFRFFLLSVSLNIFFGYNSVYVREQCRWLCEIEKFRKVHVLAEMNFCLELELICGESILEREEQVINHRTKKMYRYNYELLYIFFMTLEWMDATTTHNAMWNIVCRTLDQEIERYHLWGVFAQLPLPNIDNSLRMYVGERKWDLREFNTQHIVPLHHFDIVFTLQSCYALLNGNIHLNILHILDEKNGKYTNHIRNNNNYRIFSWCSRDPTKRFNTHLQMKNNNRREKNINNRCKYRWGAGWAR